MTPLPGVNAKAFARFASKVDVTHGCWLWKAGTFPGRGYGQFYVNGKSVGAHRFAWVSLRGAVPDGLCVLHDCPDGDNRLCVNPSHLWLGTLGDNNRDRQAKGRSARGDRSGARLHPESLPRGDAHHARAHPERLARGERQGNARLNVLAVRVIRLLARRGVPQWRLGAAYGIDRSTVSQIKRGKTWRHVV